MLEQTAYERLFGFIEEAVLTQSMARQAGLWLRMYTEKQQERILRDALIAATAVGLGAVIYTRNERDFHLFSAAVQRY